MLTNLLIIAAQWMQKNIEIWIKCYGKQYKNAEQEWLRSLCS